MSRHQEVHWAGGAGEGAQWSPGPAGAGTCDFRDSAYEDVDAVALDRRSRTTATLTMDTKTSSKPLYAARDYSVGADVDYHHYGAHHDDHHLGSDGEVSARVQCMRAVLALLAVVMTVLAIAGQVVPFCQYTTTKSRYTFSVWQSVRSRIKRVKTRRYPRQHNEGEKAMAILTVVLSFVSAVLAIVYASWNGCRRRMRASHANKHAGRDSRVADAAAAAVEAGVRHEEEHERRRERARRDREIGIATFSMFVAATFCGLVTMALMANFYTQEILRVVEDEDDEFARLSAGFGLFVALTAIGLVAFLLLAIPCVAGLRLCVTQATPAHNGRYASGRAAARYVAHTEHTTRDEHVGYERDVAMRAVATPPLPMPMQPPAQTPAHARSPLPAHATGATEHAAVTAPPVSSVGTTFAAHRVEGGTAVYGAYEYTRRSPADLTRPVADGVEVRQSGSPSHGVAFVTRDVREAPATAVYTPPGKAAPPPAPAPAHVAAAAGSAFPATTMAALPLEFRSPDATDGTVKGDEARTAPWQTEAAAPQTAVAKSRENSATSKAADALPPPQYHTPSRGKSLE